MPTELTPETFDAALRDTKGVMLIDFWAPWCGPCKAMAPIMEALDEELADVTFAKVNVDDHASLAQRYNILSIPTFIVMKDGVPAEQFAGSMPKEVLKAKLAAHLS